jgi:transcriptional regulator with XRE-family HTH domain
MKRSLKILSTIGTELRNIRKINDISLAEVAEQAGVSTMYISEIERDKKSPSDDVIRKLSDIYKVHEVELFEGFRRIPEPITEELLTYSDLFEGLYKISISTKITIKEKENLYREFNKMCDKIIISK